MRNLDAFKEAELKKVEDAFKKMRDSLAEREANYKRMYIENVKSQFMYMSQESMKLRHICTEVNMIYEDLTKIQGYMEKFDDFTVVGSCQKVKLYEE